jgi:hypothetical protein
MLLALLGSRNYVRRRIVFTYEQIGWTVAMVEYSPIEEGELGGQSCG